MSCRMSAARLVTSIALSAAVMLTGCAAVQRSETRASSEGDPLQDAVGAAVNDVLGHAIAFVPTVVGVLDARVVGNRIDIQLLFADDDGAAIMKRPTDAGAYEL